MKGTGDTWDDVGIVPYGRGDGGYAGRRGAAPYRKTLWDMPKAAVRC